MTAGKLRKGKCPKCDGRKIRSAGVSFSYGWYRRYYWCAVCAHHWKGAGRRSYAAAASEHPNKAQKDRRTKYVCTE